MIRITARFLALLVLLLAVGAFDHAAQRKSTNPRALAPSRLFPVAHALPIANDVNRRPSKSPRIGIVVKSGKSFNAAGKSFVARSQSAFPTTSDHQAISLQLKRIEPSLATNPLMLYQHHINRANNKLASIFKRPPLSNKRIQQELERRKLSILARRSKTFRSSAERRNAKPRLGLPKSDAHSSRSLDPAHSTTSTSTSRSIQDKIVSLFNMFNRRSTSYYNTRDGYPEANLKASTSDSLYKAGNPTADQSLGLDIESNDIGYVIDVQIGANKSPFRLLVDSGSADTWVPSTKCTACGNKHSKLGKSKSSTFRAVNQEFSIQYGTGTVSGTLARDSLVIANMELKNHTFGLVTTESVEFSDDSIPFDGLMGLAQGILSNAGLPTPIESLYSSGLVRAPVMGYHLGRVADGFNDGQVTFGGVDPSRFKGNLTEIQNVSKEGFWQVPIDSISFGGKELGLNGRTAILDTGTTLIVAPQKDADKIHAMIPGSRPDGQGGYTIPCTTKERVTFKLGGKKFSIDPRDLLFLPVDKSNLNGECVSSISAGKIANDNDWLVGATFLKNVYFATNVKTNTIGLAPLNHKS